MSNQIYENKLYNSEIKESFLNQYPEGTQRTYRRVFERSYMIEEILRKDIYDFNLQEIKEILANLNPLTVAASITNGRVISGYINWAIKNGHRNNISPFETVTESHDWFTQFVDKNKKLFITEEELYDIEESLINYQDKVILRLVFSGIEGTGVSEVTSLTEDKIDRENYTLKLTDIKKGERVLNLKEIYGQEYAERTFDLIEGALREKTYFKRNGDVAENTKAPEADLAENKYVVKNTITRTNRHGEVDKHTIYRRVSMVGELFDLPYLSVTTLSKSGQTYLAKLLLEREGTLDKDQYLQVADIFNFSKVKNGKSYVRNWWKLKDYVTTDNISKMYNIK